MRETTTLRLLEPCRARLTSYCPTIDLIATVSRAQAGKAAGEVVEVWRANGQIAQKVFGVVAPEGFGGGGDDEDGTRSEVKVESLVWRPDGKVLAVAWDCGVVVVVDAYNGKAAHLLRVRGEGGGGSGAGGRLLPDWSGKDEGLRKEKGKEKGDEGDSVKLGGGYAKMSWQSHFANPAEVRRQLSGANAEARMMDSGDGVGVGLDDLLGLNADIGKLLNAKANLPRELSRIEVEVALPKLSTLPATATGGDEDIFSTRHSIDTIFHAANAVGGELRSNSAVGDDVVDVLLTNVGSCAVHISIYDSFVVGTVDAGVAMPKGLKAKRVVQDASHPFLTTHCLVVEAVKDGRLPASNEAEETSLHLVALDLRFITQTGYNLPLLATKATHLQNLLRYLTQISTLLSAEMRTAFDLPSRFLENINEALAEGNEGANFMTQAYHLIVTGMCNETFREWLVDQVGDRGLKRWEKAVGDCLDLIRRMTSECLLPAVERAQIVLSRLDGLSRFSDTASRLGLEEKNIRAIREVLDVLNILCEDMLRDVCTEIREFAAFMRWLKWEMEVQTLGEDSERAEEMREAYAGEAEIRTVLDYIQSAMKTSRLTRFIRADAKTATTGPETDTADLLESYKKARVSQKGLELLKLSDLLLSLTQRSQVVFSSIAETLRKNVLVSYAAELPNSFHVSQMASRIVDSAEEGHFDLHILSEETDQGRLVNLTYTIDQVARSSVKLQRTRTFDHTAETRIESIHSCGDSEFLVLHSNKDSGDSMIVSYPLSGLDTQPELRHVYTSGDMGTGMTPGGLAVAGRKGRNKIVVTDKEQMGFVVLEE